MYIPVAKHSRRLFARPRIKYNQGVSFEINRTLNGCDVRGAIRASWWCSVYRVQYRELAKEGWKQSETSQYVQKDELWIYVKRDAKHKNKRRNEGKVCVYIRPRGERER